MGCETNLCGLAEGHVGAFLERGNEISGCTKCEKFREFLRNC